MDEININDFAKVDLRVAKILSAEDVEDADKLLKIILDLGEFGQKTVFAGIKKFYEPNDLTGKLVVCVNNLKFVLNEKGGTALRSRGLSLQFLDLFLRIKFLIAIDLIFLLL